MQIVWARYAFAVPVILVTTPLAAWPTLLRVASPRLQAVRGLMPVLASFAVVAGLALLPLAEVTALTFASPLSWWWPCLRRSWANAPQSTTG